jgi:HlyD family secretion protein
VLALEDAKLERHTLVTRVDGLVVDVHLDPGELAAIGTPAATIADVTHPYVDVFVPEGKLAGIKLGTRADVRVDTGARAVGAVEYVSPKTEFTPRFLFSERERPNLVVRVRVRLEDPKHDLHAGIPAFARFLP